MTDPRPITEGVETFSIESRIVRELGERLVKHPEVALLELVKNSYDADALVCKIVHEHPTKIAVSDDGHGMTLNEFKNAWMRIGTSSKASRIHTRRFGRPISGEKGIGRFAARYLGHHLILESTAYDEQRSKKTTLRAVFNWPAFDRSQDLGSVTVPYQLFAATSDAKTGTTLTITKLRENTQDINFWQITTSSLSLISPYQAILKDISARQSNPQTGERAYESDPGFDISIDSPGFGESTLLAGEILKNPVLRCVVRARDGRISLRVYRKGQTTPSIKINDKYPTHAGEVHADLRFFPQRKGTFTGMKVDGRQAKTWLKTNAGVAVFDQNFRVLPYGLPGDDWLSLAADTARNERHPKSLIANRHFPMEETTRKSTKLNYMLRLPQPSQLVGAVQVAGVRTQAQKGGGNGLLVTSDREGFVDNEAYRSLIDLVRGAAEVLAYEDREVQQEEDRLEAQRLAEVARKEAKEAIAQIQANANLNAAEKRSLVSRLTAMQSAQKQQVDISKSREDALEVMSLMGVIAGFMTHEFRTAITILEQTRATIERLARKHPALSVSAKQLSDNIRELKEFVTYSQGYIRGASIVHTKPIPAKPRIQQVLRVLANYASTRNIKVNVDVGSDVTMPRVPLSLYSGLVLNLYTNALKAVTSKVGSKSSEIAIRAWNEKNTHILQVSDTGVGVPDALKERIFDPMFTTTESNRDPLGSGMGLGLSIVRRGARAFNGSVSVVKAPPGFTTCFEVKLPLGVAT